MMGANPETHILRRGGSRSVETTAAGSKERRVGGYFWKGSAPFPFVIVLNSVKGQDRTPLTLSFPRLPTKTAVSRTHHEFVSRTCLCSGDGGKAPYWNHSYRCDEPRV